MQLSAHQQEFVELGIQIAVITYESPDINFKFSNRHKINYPILTDPDVQYVRALGILNESFEPGHRAYGVPHPGIFLVDINGIVRAKFSEEGYRKRPAVELVIQAAKKMIMNETMTQ